MSPNVRDVKLEKGFLASKRREPGMTFLFRLTCQEDPFICPTIAISEAKQSKLCHSVPLHYCSVTCKALQDTAAKIKS